ERRRALLPRAAGRPDLGGHVRDPAPDHRSVARAARRREGRRVSVEARTGDAPANEAEPVLPPIDLRPLFAPRSIAVVGASARGGIAQTVAAHLGVMGSPPRCFFVNPRYDELYGEPCYPSMDALPELPDT